MAMALKAFQMSQLDLRVRNRNTHPIQLPCACPMLPRHHLHWSLVPAPSSSLLWILLLGMFSQIPAWQHPLRCQLHLSLYSNVGISESHLKLSASVNLGLPGFVLLIAVSLLRSLFIQC